MWLLALLPAIAAPMELTYNGRVADSVGTPLQGSVSLSVALFDGSGATATELYREPFAQVPIDDGYFSLVLGGGAVPLDGAVLAHPEVWVEVTVGEGEPLSRRQKLASTPYAHVAGRIPVASEGEEGLCTDTGLVLWDTSIDGLRVCDGTSWRRLVSRKTVRLVGGSRRWSNGTYAPNCKGYLMPTDADYGYDDDVGDGLYRIDPTGSDPFDVTCDMTGGGWTVIPETTDFAYQTWSEGETVKPYVYAVSNARINAIKAVSTEGYQDWACRTNGVIRTDYQSNWVVFSSGTPVQFPSCQDPNNSAMVSDSGRYSTLVDLPAREWRPEDCGDASEQCQHNFGDLYLR